MPDINLIQAEADVLITMEKHRVNDDRWDYPGLGGAIFVPLISVNKRENFLLDISRGKIDLLKGTYQNRSRRVIVLVFLDFRRQPQRNPDGEHIPSVTVIDALKNHDVHPVHWSRKEEVREELAT